MLGNSRRSSLLVVAALLAIALRCEGLRGAEPDVATVRIETRWSPPTWALLERELLRAASGPAGSSSAVISTIEATSNASNVGAATTGPTTRSRTSTTGRCCMPSAAMTRS